MTLKTRNINNLCNRSDLYIALEAGYIDNKIATACGVLFNNEKNIIYSLDARYNKVKTAVFEKIFSRHFSETAETANNPYKEFISFEDIKISGSTLFTIIPEVSKERCAGHFMGYPILPTEFVIYNIINHAGNFLLQKINKKRYYVSEVNLSLIELLYLKSRKEIEIRYSHIDDFSHKMDCKIIQDGKKNSNISFTVHCI